MAEELTMKVLTMNEVQKGGPQGVGGFVIIKKMPCRIDKVWLVTTMLSVCKWIRVCIYEPLICNTIVVNLLGGSILYPQVVEKVKGTGPTANDRVVIKGFSHVPIPNCHIFDL
jgi:hypothetical protein